MIKEDQMYAQINKPKKLKDKKKIDIAENKKTKLCIYGAAAAVSILMVVIGLLIEPISTLFETTGVMMLVLRFVIVIALLAACLYLHEYIHVITIKKLSGETCKIDFRKLYACVLTDSYFSKRGYLIVCFAPVAIIGILLLLLMIILPSKCFWILYIAEILNIAGAAGDVYTAIILLKEKSGLWIKDEVNYITYWKR